MLNKKPDISLVDQLVMRVQECVTRREYQELSE